MSKYGVTKNNQTTPVYPLPAWQNFLFSTTSPQLAVLFTNPFDTAKVRLQLQGQSGEKVYKNSIDCLVKIYKNEGIQGLQKVGTLFITEIIKKYP